MKTNIERLKKIIEDFEILEKRMESFEKFNVMIGEEAINYMRNLNASDHVAFGEEAGNMVKEA